MPHDAGVSVALVEWCARTKTPLLGVCLGHQAIAEAYGARIVRAPKVMHGKTSLVHHNGEGVLAELPSPFEAGRYHSLAVEREHLADELHVTAWTEEGVVMGVRHSSLPIEGVQFHPESILTPDGMAVLRAFLNQ
jgi:anthranilate synthase/aminodeoxychorismate synthase-like glutamine amidotransferase